MIHDSDVVGYKILSNVYQHIIKTLLNNSGKNVHNTLQGIFRGETQEEVIENIKVVGNTINNSIHSSQFTDV